MTEPLVFKRGTAVGLLVTAQALLPPFITGGLLALLAWRMNVAFKEDFILLIVIATALAAALMQPQRDITPQLIAGRAQIAGRIALRWLVVIFTLLVLGYATKTSDEFSRRVVLTWGVVTPLVLAIATLITHQAIRRMLSDPAAARRAVFVGYNEISLSLAQRLTENSAVGMTVVGFFDDRAPERLGAGDHNNLLLGGFTSIVDHVKAHSIDVVFVALPINHLVRVKKLLDDLQDTTASVYYVPTVFPFDSIQGGSGEFLGVPVVALCETPFHGSRGLSKRLTDIALAASILVLAAPLMALTALLIKLGSPGPVIFKQRRYGLDGQQIMVYKFRTMTVMEDGERIAQATKEDARVTAIGRILRRTSIDELPQLINVLEGRMSLVGPRPHAVAHNELYRKLIKGYMVRHKVAPGITGLAQVHGLRGETSTVEQMEARLRYDLEYLRNWSPLLDVKILLKTLLIIARGDKAY